jgi:hypothetical protein
MITGWQLVASAGRIVACRWMPIPGAGNDGMLFERDRRAGRGQVAARYLYSCIVAPEDIDSVF